jgi:hypothetical protein
MRRPLKKLSDEVVPVLRHLNFIRFEGEVRFELSDAMPDCWLRDEGETAEQGLEVTVAQARERHELAKEMNREGIGRGFLGLPDDAPKAVFDTKLASPRVMHSPVGVITSVKSGIERCLIRKRDPKYSGHDLLIDAPLRLLSAERWEETMDELREVTIASPFRHIHVIGNHDQQPLGFQIK